MAAKSDDSSTASTIPLSSAHSPCSIKSEPLPTPRAKITDEDLCIECLLEEHKESFDRNLVLNPFGNCERTHECIYVCYRLNPHCTQYVSECIHQNCPRFKHWNIVDSGGKGWSVEETPVGCDPLPAETGGKSCFATSYGFCSKQQLIDLAENGLSDRIMDEVQPDLEVVDWYAARRDCACEYLLKASLLDSHYVLLQVHGERHRVKQGDGGAWHQVRHVFSGYGPGVRYVIFSHAGQDTQFWEGHFGSKMAASSVIARMPQVY